MADNAYDKNKHRADDADPSSQSGRPFIVSGMVLVLLAVLAVLALIGFLVLG